MTLERYGRFLTMSREGKGKQLTAVSLATGIPLPTLEAAEDGTHRLSTSDWQKLIAHLNVKVPDGICRGCGCVEASACVGGCSWALPNVCSSCHALADWYQRRMTSLLEMIGTPAKCRSCEKPCYWVTTKKRRSLLVSQSGVAHYADCPHSAESKREKVRKSCQVD